MVEEEADMAVELLMVAPQLDRSAELVDQPELMVELDPVETMVDLMEVLRTPRTLLQPVVQSATDISNNTQAFTQPTL